MTHLNKRRWIGGASIVTLLSLTLLNPAALAQSHHLNPAALAQSQAGFNSVRQATAAYHDVEAAMAAGYTIELPDIYGQTCIVDLSVPSAGAMGIHMVSLDRVLDPTLDESDPEILVYERRNDGTLRLVSVEWVVFDVGQPTPHLFGVPFHWESGERYGVPPFYGLHAWIWKPNPSGILSLWNPNVGCDL